jgi:hypothetical protein
MPLTEYPSCQSLHLSYHVKQTKSQASQTANLEWKGAAEDLWPLGTILVQP